MQTASWSAWPPFDTNYDRRAERAAARETFERARRIFDRYEAALFWPPGMLLSPAGGWWGARIWTRYCQDFLNLGEARWPLTATELIVICACAARDSMAELWSGRPGGLHDAESGVSARSRLFRQMQIAGLAMLLVRSRDAGRSACQAIERASLTPRFRKRRIPRRPAKKVKGFVSIDTAKIRAEEGVCYE